ncbi:MAG: 23S rRNA (uracil(1939)-C(5))-methyltransferase RlmD [Acidobacteria bacterium]|nr:23S rRNA (uracil(1939)-C(5))-methyltransferase RlmD [Acidobacteriota bacterium]
MQLQIQKIVYGGSGFAHSTEGKAVFVPFTLPGEVVEASLDSEKGGFAEASLDAVQEPSTDRVSPKCAHFGACGGCQYQHAEYPAQLEIKRGILMETLERAGLTSLPHVHLLASEPWEYRNRIRLRVAEIDGRLRAGYLRRASTEFLPVHMCPIASPILWRAIEALLTLKGAALQWVRLAEEVELFTDRDQSRLQLTLLLRKEPAADFSGLCEALHSALPELTGAGVALIEGNGRSRKTQRIKPLSHWGADGLSYPVGGKSYWVTRGSFFQVNRALLEPFAALVTANRAGKLAWDLYAGVGLFSQRLAESFTGVVAVEAAASDLVRSFRGPGRRAVQATTVEFLRQAALERDRPELVVVDPPRAGIGQEACSLLMRVKPHEIVYVSCDPATLGRDLKQMVDSGYKLHELHMVDMFPQTFHQETVAVLRPEKQAG